VPENILVLFLLYLNRDNAFMSRRRVLTDAQITALFALPTAEADLIRHYTLDLRDMAAIASRRRPRNRLGFALQLCALRHPGRLIRPGELVPLEVVRFVGEQFDIDPGELAGYAARAPTRYDHFDVLQAIFGFRRFSQPDHRALSDWLLPIALTTVSGMAVAETLMMELRRQGIVAPGATVLERLVATALLRAERHVANQLTRGLTESQRNGLDTLLEIHSDHPMSSLAWVRQPPGVRRHEKGPLSAT
jgi:hypothetical protein